MHFVCLVLDELGETHLLMHSAKVVGFADKSKSQVLPRKEGEHGDKLIGSESSFKCLY